MTTHIMSHAASIISKEKKDAFLTYRSRRYAPVYLYVSCTQFEDREARAKIAYQRARQTQLNQR